MQLFIENVNKVIKIKDFLIFLLQNTMEHALKSQVLMLLDNSNIQTVC